jgi:hypothetical protein
MLSYLGILEVKGHRFKTRSLQTPKRTASLLTKKHTFLFYAVLFEYCTIVLHPTNTV